MRGDVLEILASQLELYREWIAAGKPLSAPDVSALVRLVSVLHDIEQHEKREAYLEYMRQPSQADTRS